MRSTFFTLFLGTFFLMGCGGGAEGPELGTVTGIITVNGEPTSGLTVYFESASGASSLGTTNEEGRYQLDYPGNRSGAELGPNVVRIIGRDASLSAGMLDEMAAAQGTSVEELKKLPVISPQYNEQSTLSADVQAGSNEFNFDVKQ